MDSNLQWVLFAALLGIVIGSVGPLISQYWARQDRDRDRASNERLARERLESEERRWGAQLELQHEQWYGQNFLERKVAVLGDLHAHITRLGLILKAIRQSPTEAQCSKDLKIEIDAFFEASMHGVAYLTPDVTHLVRECLTFARDQDRLMTTLQTALASADANVYTPIIKEIQDSATTWTQVFSKASGALSRELDPDIVSGKSRTADATTSISRSPTKTKDPPLEDRTNMASLARLTVP